MHSVTYFDLRFVVAICSFVVLSHMRGWHSQISWHFVGIDVA